MDKIEEEACIPDHYYALGVDLAYPESFSVMTVIDANQLRVVAWRRVSHPSYSFHLDETLRLAKKYAATVVVSRYANGAGDALLDELTERGLSCYGYRFNEPNRGVLMELLTKAIQQRVIDIPGFAYGEQRVPYDEMTLSLALAYLEASKPFEPANEEKAKRHE